MRTQTHRIVIAAALGLSLTAAAVESRQAAAAAQPAAGPPTRWYKGNTHTHTVNNGGDSTPDEVVRWYREHDYQFLVLTDHNFLTNVNGLNAVHGADEKFLVIPGEEVTSRAGDKPVHVNGLDLERLVPAHEGGTVAETLQANIDGIRSASGVPHVNHPNFGWGITAEQLRDARNYKLFEVHNGHPSVNNAGGGGVPGLEDVWDRLLSTGLIVYGVATDDAHVFKDPGNPRVSGPGRGWVSVRAPRLEADALMQAMERGDFYASTGVVLEEVHRSPTGMSVKVKSEGASKYRIQFIGRGGKLLSESIEPSATYTFAGDEGYVRAKVIESNGRVAWVQPVAIPPAATSSAAAVWMVAAAAGAFALVRGPRRGAA